MMIKQRGNREEVEIFSIEEFVPSDHLLRKIDRAIDFTHILTHIYDFVEDLYCADNGRLGIDPVVIFIKAGKNINYLTFLKNLHTFLDKAKYAIHRWRVSYPADFSDSFYFFLHVFLFSPKSQLRFRAFSTG